MVQSFSILWSKVGRENKKKMWSHFYMLLRLLETWLSCHLPLMDRVIWCFCVTCSVCLVWWSVRIRFRNSLTSFHPLLPLHATLRALRHTQCLHLGEDQFIVSRGHYLEECWADSLPGCLFCVSANQIPLSEGIQLYYMLGSLYPLDDPVLELDVWAKCPLQWARLLLMQVCRDQNTHSCFM